MRRVGTLLLLIAFGGCGDDGGAAFDAASPPDAATPDATTVPITWPSSPDEYSGSLIGYLYEIEMPEVVDSVAVCCRDFGEISKDYIEDGTDEIDNALARLTNALGDTFDLQTSLNESIQDGELALLLDHRELDGDPDMFVFVELFGGFDNGTDYAKASAGNGDFVVLRESFVAGTGEPKNVFNPSFVSDGEMVTTPDEFVMALPLGSGLLFLPIADTLVEGQLVSGPDGATYMNATAAGYFLLEDLFELFNETVLDPSCACLGISEPIYVEIAPGVWDGRCVEDAEVLCAEPEQETCKTLADPTLADGICGAGPAIFAAMADIDLDGDPSIYEAVSTGFVWHSVPATITGAAPAQN